MCVIVRKHRFAQILRNILCDIILYQSKNFIRPFIKFEGFIWTFFKMKN